MANKKHINHDSYKLGKELMRCQTSRFWIFAPPLFFLILGLSFLSVSIFSNADIDTIILTILFFFLSLSYSFKGKYELILYEEGIKATRLRTQNKSVTVSFLFNEIEWLTYANVKRNKKLDLWSEGGNRRTEILFFFMLEVRWYTFIRQLKNNYSQWVQEHHLEKFNAADFWRDKDERMNRKITRS